MKGQGWCLRGTMTTISQFDQYCTTLHPWLSLVKEGIFSLLLTTILTFTHFDTLYSPPLQFGTRKNHFSIDLYSCLICVIAQKHTFSSAAFLVGSIKHGNLQ